MFIKQGVSPFLQKWDNPMYIKHAVSAFYKNGTIQCISNTELVLLQKWDNPMHIKHKNGTTQCI